MVNKAGIIMLCLTAMVVSIALASAYILAPKPIASIEVGRIEIYISQSEPNFFFENRMEYKSTSIRIVIENSRFESYINLISVIQAQANNINNLDERERIFASGGR